MKTQVSRAFPYTLGAEASTDHVLKIDLFKDCRLDRLLSLLRDLVRVISLHDLRNPKIDKHELNGIRNF
jgi:hypothetical protein